MQEDTNTLDPLELLDGLSVAVLRFARIQEAAMVDAHQVNTIIAAAICDCRKDHPAGRIDPEEAKTIAKCILEQLSQAGFQIVFSDGER